MKIYPNLNKIVRLGKLQSQQGQERHVTAENWNHEGFHLHKVIPIPRLILYSFHNAAFPCVPIHILGEQRDCLTYTLQRQY